MNSVKQAQLLKAFYEIKVRFDPVPGQFLFFDLSVENYVLYQFENEESFFEKDMVQKWWREDKPYLLFWTSIEKPFETFLIFESIDFTHEINVSKNMTTYFDKKNPNPIDIGQIRTEMGALLQLLKAG